MITTNCYGKSREWANRESAMQFFMECIASSEGSERNRYVNIYLQLIQGCNECYDEAY